ncbi:hypothetical protein IIY24_03335, partial [Candidatus Saccharibacteria bacterium]|nr:hypothetical protein [Candidatus Saccharibacteria bacterium]
YANSFEIDAGTQKKIDALFVEIEKLGEKCKNAGEFETEFQKSPLNQKYMDLFTEIATKGATKTVVKGTVAGAVESVAEQTLRNLAPTRASIHQKAYDEARKIPGIGDAIDVTEKAGYVAHLGKLFKKKKK